MGCIANAGQLAAELRQAEGCGAVKEPADPAEGRLLEAIHDEILRGERLAGVKGVGPLAAALEQRRYEQQALGEQVLEVHLGAARVILEQLFEADQTGFQFLEEAVEAQQEHLARSEADVGSLPRLRLRLPLRLRFPARRSVR